MPGKAAIPWRLSTWSCSTAESSCPENLDRLLLASWAMILAFRVSEQGAQCVPIPACALAHSACRHGFSVRCYRVPRLLSELTFAHGDGSYPKLLSGLSRMRLLVLDDWGTVPLGSS